MTEEKNKNNTIFNSRECIGLNKSLSSIFNSFEKIGLNQNFNRTFTGLKLADTLPKFDSNLNRIISDMSKYHQFSLPLPKLITYNSYKSLWGYPKEYDYIKKYFGDFQKTISLNIIEGIKKFNEQRLASIRKSLVSFPDLDFGLKSFSNILDIISDPEFINEPQQDNDTELGNINEETTAAVLSELLPVIPDEKDILEKISDLKKQYGSKTVKFIIIFITGLITTHLYSLCYDYGTKPLIENIISIYSNDQKCINKIKRIPLINPDLFLDNMRFITKDVLPLKLKKTLNSPTIIHLSLGQEIQVLEKRKNFIFCRVFHDGCCYEGWVLTRYTSNFKKR